uniref:KxDL domain-containing protein n=1 Tax=Trichobilharzia regenti TaxID=157069 RepID=A0AA85K6Q4_TRIRE|nr:unnamed protein product [Trichobilharzia regenti]
MSAAESFGDSLNAVINSPEAVQIIQQQEIMLSKFEKTNEMLRTVSELSEGRYRILCQELNTHTKTILSLKKEMNDVFKRIRSIKKLLATYFPDDMERLSQQLASRNNTEDAGDDCNPVLHNAVSSRLSEACTIPKAMETVCEDSSLE